MRTRIASIVVAAALTAWSACSQAIVVDGINTAGEYTELYSLSFTHQGSANVYTGELGLAYDGTDIFVLLSVPTDLTDLTFYENAAPGWNGHPAVSGVDGYKKVSGSEKWIFELAGETVELKNTGRSKAMSRSPLSFLTYFKSPLIPR